MVIKLADILKHLLDSNNVRYTTSGQDVIAISCGMTCCGVDFIIYDDYTL